MSTLGNTSDNAGPSFTMASFLTSHGNFLPFHQPPYQMYMPPMMDNLLNPNRHLPYRYDHQKFMSPPRLSPHSTTGSENSENEQNSPNNSNKPSTRPFKLYSKDPISMSFGIPTEAILNKNSEEAYAEFREKMLTQSQNNTNLNKNMRRSIHTQNNDPEYLERRKKNNEAAKRSRDARKAKEDEIAIRCAFLEKENLHLKIKIATLENERDRLHSMIYR